MKTVIALAFGVTLCAAGTAAAASATATVNKIDETGVGAAVGKLKFSDSKGGLKIMPALKGLPPGPHGFHVHANGNCGAAENNGKMTAGFAAGGHFDPASSGKHLGPESTEGHKGDLPVLVVDANGNAKTPVVAPHLKVKDVKGHAIVIHSGGDNYADQPAPAGGGGARIACAVVQ